MSAASQRALEEHLRAERMSELSAEIYAALKESAPILEWRNHDLYEKVVKLIARIEGWPQ